MTMPTIRVDDDVYGRLQRDAEPFVDTPNSVLRRVLGIDTTPLPEPESDDASEARRMRPGELLDRRTYDLPILAVLDSMGGAGYAPDVVEAVGKQVEGELTPNDWLENKSGVVRWRNRVAWRRFNLIKMGLLASDSPRGTWAITDTGRKALAKGAIPYGD